MIVRFSNYELPEFVRLAADFGSDKYAFVVTPNVDHLIRYYDDPNFRESYSQAGFVLLDSRFFAGILRLVGGVRVPVCPGSDITERLLTQVVTAEDHLVVVGGTEAQARTLVEKFGLRGLKHYNPPMGFIKDPAEVEKCLEFIENESPFRFCLLAVGSPQQEVLARALAERGRARGLALCVGASIDFLTGGERRAPLWLQNLSLEWLYRLLNNPSRMARRYLIRGPRIFLLLPRMKFMLGAAPAKSDVLNGNSTAPASTALGIKL